MTQALTSFLSTANTDGPFTGSETVQLMRYLLGDDVADLLGLPAGSLPTAMISLLKIVGTWQAMQYIPVVTRAYQSQFADYKKHNGASILEAA
ncbi:hypothetical protein KHS38_12710 [Mucilaginibacter sp. Bleaf8]|uniref:hypothetical protein n=1 Tax=Mucilaginibacter sp. Bleaf8 TaxID=2834430 RepID=UPI001BCB843A|nr:hypothetical protein [Mucilaginibacter sp. Bleaf8]MBS7565267.1 hypothetical protein [Mucilaginibacter sp. Bleaf8]